MKTYFTAVIFMFIMTGKALGGQFSWEAEVVNNSSREKKSYAPTDKEFLMSDIGGYKCIIKQLESVDGPLDFVEKRMLACSLGGATIGVEVSCKIYKKNNKVERNEEELHLFNSKGDDAFVVSIECE